MESDSGQKDPWWLRAERDMRSDTSFEALCDQQEAIETREDLVPFIEALRDDLSAHPTSWENGNLKGYLEALAAVTESISQGYKNRGETMPEQPTWQLMGDLLLTTRIYE